MEMIKSSDSLFQKQVKSVTAGDKFYVKFINLTQRTVVVLWLNYNGEPVPYATLEPHKGLKMNTFASHPWIFVEMKTGLLMAVKSKYVFEVDSYVKELQESMDNSSDNRVNVDVCLPIWSLKQHCFNVISQYFVSFWPLKTDYLPNSIVDDLVKDILCKKKLVDSINNAHSPNNA